MLEKLSRLGNGPRVMTERLILRPPKMSDWSQWAELREESRSFLVPWEPSWGPNALSKASFRVRLRRIARDVRDDQGQSFFLFRRDSGDLVGGITLGNIRRGVAQTGTIGYWAGAPHARKGYMFEALCGLMPCLFTEFGLRRVEAACLPANIPSARLLEKVGFTREGLAREYLCINGVWHDHLLYALLDKDPIGGASIEP